MNDNNFVKLGDVAHECRLTWSGEQTNIPIVGLEHLIPGEIELSSWDSNIEHTFSKKFTKGQVLLGRRRVYLKKAVVAPCDGICSGDITVIESTGGILPELLPFVIQNDRFFDYAMQGSAGSLSPRVKWEHLKNYEFSLPPLAEQKVLAEKLWAAYRLKESYKKLLVATEEMVKSQFIEMFGNQDVNEKGWNESFVKDEFTLTMGKTPARNNPAYWQPGTNKWISISDMANYGRYTSNTQETITDIAVSESGIKLVPKGTIIMSFKLSIGRTAITSEDIYTNEAIMAFGDVDMSKFNIAFLQFLIANKNWLLNAKQAVKGHTLNKESIGNAKIIVPPIELQERFATIYDQADKSGFELRKSIDAIDAVIKSLINS